METPSLTPVVFKSLCKTEVCLRSLQLKYCTIEYYKHEAEKSGYYLLVNDADPSRPIKLYSSGMNKIIKLLPYAVEEAKKLESQPQLEDNDTFDCGIVHTYGNISIRLVLSIFKGKVYIWLKLYTINEDHHFFPTKTAVRFSDEDNIEAMSQFIANAK